MADDNLILREKPGRRTWHDPHTGVIVKQELDPGEASRISKIKEEKRPTVEALLKEFGWEDVDNAPEYARILAKVASKEQGYSKAAIEGLMAISPKRAEAPITMAKDNQPKMVRPRPGEVCALCGVYNLDGLIPSDVLAKFVLEFGVIPAGADEDALAEIEGAGASREPRASKDD